MKILLLQGVVIMLLRANKTFLQAFKFGGSCWQSGYNLSNHRKHACILGLVVFSFAHEFHGLQGSECFALDWCWEGTGCVWWGGWGGEKKMTSDWKGMFQCKCWLGWSLCNLWQKPGQRWSKKRLGACLLLHGSAMGVCKWQLWGISWPWCSALLSCEIQVAATVCDSTGSDTQECCWKRLVRPGYSIIYNSQVCS